MKNFLRNSLTVCTLVTGLSTTLPVLAQSSQETTQDRLTAALIKTYNDQTILSGPWQNQRKEKLKKLAEECGEFMEGPRVEVVPLETHESYIDNGFERDGKDFSVVGMNESGKYIVIERVDCPWKRYNQAFIIQSLAFEGEYEEEKVWLNTEAEPEKGKITSKFTLIGPALGGLYGDKEESAKVEQKVDRVSSSNAVSESRRNDPVKEPRRPHGGLRK